MTSDSEWNGSEACELLVEIILRDVEYPNLRRMLEHVIRQGKVQRACILKDMFLKAAAASQ